jgi:hypothetical protein
MVKAIQDFLFGLCFGAGFACAQGLINLLLMILGSGHHV